MKAKFLAGLLVPAIYLLGSAALAETKRLPGGVTAPHKTIIGPAKPLTVQECEGLGGAVKDTATANCKTGKMCARADQYGVIRTICITKL